MQAPPFQITSEAEAFVCEYSRPRAGMQAVLFSTTGYEERDEDQNIRAEFQGELFLVGCYFLEQVDQYPQFAIGGSVISIHPDDLDRLRNKTLTVKKLKLRRDAQPQVSPIILVTT
jgi:hypothetical protein